MYFKAKKNIDRYSAVDLLEILINKKHPEFDVAKEEFLRRDLSEEELRIAKINLDSRLKIRNKPLGIWDKLSCLIIPFSAPRSPFIYDIKEMENNYNNYEDEFNYYGETKKAEQLQTWKGYGYLLYFSMFLLFVIVMLIITLVNVL